MSEQLLLKNLRRTGGGRSRDLDRRKVGSRSLVVRYFYLRPGRVVVLDSWTPLGPGTGVG